MLLTRKSILTGKEHTREVPVTEQALTYYFANRGAVMIQDAFPDLSSDDREFILSGITPEEWDAEFKEPDD